VELGEANRNEVEIGEANTFGNNNDMSKKCIDSWLSRWPTVTGRQQLQEQNTVISAEPPWSKSRA
jgi:hypothetical protein